MLRKDENRSFAELSLELHRQLRLHIHRLPIHPIRLEAPPARRLDRGRCERLRPCHSLQTHNRPVTGDNRVQHDGSRFAHTLRSRCLDFVNEQSLHYIRRNLDGRSHRSSLVRNSRLQLLPSLFPMPPTHGAQNDCDRYGSDPRRMPVPSSRALADSLFFFQNRRPDQPQPACGLHRGPWKIHFRLGRCLRLDNFRQSPPRSCPFRPIADRLLLFWTEPQELHPAAHRLLIAHSRLRQHRQTQMRQPEFHPHQLARIQIPGDHRTNSAFAHIHRSPGNPFGLARAQNRHIHRHRNRIARRMPPSGCLKRL